MSEVVKVRVQAHAHKKRSIAAIVSLMLLCESAQSLRADTVEIRGGGQLSGNIKRIDVEKTPFVVVELDDKIRVAVPASQVGHVAATENLEEYRKLAAEAGDDANKHFELARWCKEKLLLAQNKHHLQRAISVDPITPKLVPHSGLSNRMVSGFAFRSNNAAGD